MKLDHCLFAEDGSRVFFIEMARTMLWLVHHPDATDGHRAALLGRLGSVIAEIWGPDTVQPFITYFLSAFGHESALRATMIESASPEVRHMYTTMREQLIAEGEARGLAKGEAKGTVETLAKTIERALHARNLELTDELRERLTQCRDEALLLRWFDRSLTATSLDEVFDD